MVQYRQERRRQTVRSFAFKIFETLGVAKNIRENWCRAGPIEPASINNHVSITLCGIRKCYPLVGASGLMLSCYWVQPAQLHPWFKPATLKRKSPSMSFRSESPSPVDEDEDDPDARVKRPRRTTLTLGEHHTRPQKRKLPSFLQSPTEEEEEKAEEDLATMTVKRQRCTTLECGIEHLSLTPPNIPAPPPPEFAARSSAPLGAPSDFRWLPALPPAAGTPSFQQISSPTNLDPSPTLIMAPILPESTTDAIEDIKMRSSSWYEPEKDSAYANATIFLVLLT